MTPSLPRVVETERLLLRPFELGDVDDVYAYARDEEWSRYLRMLPRPYERVHAEQFVARQILLDWVEHVAWAVVLEDRVRGGIGLRFDFPNRRAELGYSIAREEWGKGYCTEAARAVIDAGFRIHDDLVRIHARADASNAASQRVMAKAGMTKEGVLRQSRVERGEVFDEAWYSMLREEWER